MGYCIMVSSIFLSTPFGHKSKTKDGRNFRDGENIPRALTDNPIFGQKKSKVNVTRARRIFESVDFVMSEY